MGSVWLAQDRLLDREVAMKQIISTAGLDADEAQRLRNQAIKEGQLAARLSHNHAIAMYDVAVEGGEPWLVMEHLPSRSLAQALNTTDALPPIEVGQIGAQVADALADAHTAGIIHRDIKPGNILIANRGRAAGMVKISDFGIARTIGDPDDEDPDMITGTPAYLAPEVARGADPSAASDVFSLGATLYTAVEGEPPFGIDPDPSSMLVKVAEARINPPQRSAMLTDALLHMLEPDPNRRPTMAQARDELVAATIGANGSAAYILGAPVRSRDGSVPSWALRSRRAPSAAGWTSSESSGRSAAAPAPSEPGPSAAPGKSVPWSTDRPASIDRNTDSTPITDAPARPQLEDTQAPPVAPQPAPARPAPQQFSSAPTSQHGIGLSLAVSVALLVVTTLVVAGIVFLIASSL